MDLSPAGDRIVADVHDAESPDLVLLDAEDGTLERILASGSDEVAPSWSRDGSSVFFGSNRTGRWEVWSLRLADREPRQVTTDGGWIAREARDGASVYFMRRSEPGIWEQPLEGGEARLRIAGVLPVDGLNWAVAANGIYDPVRDRLGVRIAYFDPRDGGRQIVK